MSSSENNPALDESLFRQMFEEVPLPYHVVDFDGRLCAVNRAWLHLLGYEREDVIGRPVRDFISRSYWPQFEHSIKWLRSGKTLPGRVVELVRANGTTVVVEAEVRGDHVQENTSGHIYCLLRDITHQTLDDRAEGNLARRHALILDATPSAIVGFDAQGNITFANPAIEQLTGWGPHDLQGLNLHRSLHGYRPDGSPFPASDCLTCLSMENQESCQGETHFLRKDGSLFDVEFQAQPYFDGGAYVGGVLCFTDITERVAAVNGLQRSEEQSQHLFDKAPVSLWNEDFSSVKLFIEELKSRGVVDLKQHFLENQEDFRKCLGLVKIKNVNQATLDLYKAASQDELTANLASTFTKESTEVFLRELVALADGSSGTEAVTTIRTLDGELRHVAFKLFRDLADDHWETVYVAFMDLTPTRQIQDQNDRLVTAIEQTGDSVIVTDPQGIVLYCNPAFENITGYTSAEVLGRNIGLLKSGHHEDAFYRELWDTINQGRVWVGNFVNSRKDGSILEEEASISPVINDRGEIVSFVSVKRDMTLHHDMERRLIQSQKMEAVGQLAGGVAHDFNNILHAMLGHLEFALDEETEPANVQRELGLLRNSVGRAGQLTRQLLAFSRRQVLELQNVDPNDLIAQLLKMVRRVIGEDINLDFRPGAIDHEIHVDTGQIEQVLLNLCLNARDAMPRGGTLLIETGLKELDRKFLKAYTWAQPGPHVRIAVSDTGEGIPAQVLPQIFEPFFTTKDRGRGTGLGLATVYGTVKQHEGMILVDSEPGQGTTFTILLPVAAPGPVAEPAIAKTPSEIVGGTETILMAEDDEAVRSVISRILSRAGYRVLVASDGQEALELFAASADEIDLALLDLVMPLVGGPEVAQKIEAQRPEVKIVFNSGYSEDAILGRLSLNMDAPLLMKPHDPAALLSCIRKELDKEGR